MLNSLAKTNEVHLFWIPGHSGLDWNEKADELARKGSSTQFIGPEPCFGLSTSTITVDFT